VLCSLLVFMDMCQFRGGVFSMYFGYSDRISVLLVVLRLWVGLAGYFGWFGSGWFNTVSTRKLFSLVLRFLILCLFFSFFSLNSLVFYLFFELSLIPILLIIMG
jgi:NADH:ubiquinone oxidoreductase subunit 4 (subunit M)